MNRREFLAASAATGLTAGMVSLNACHSEPVKPPQEATSQEITGLEFIGQPYTSDEIHAIYRQGSVAVSSNTTKQPTLANCLAYYDYDKATGKGNFVSADALKPILKKGSYSIDATLRSFNLSQAHLSKASKSNNDIQIGLNYTAAATAQGDIFTWAIKNAVNILTGTADGRTGALAKFQDSVNAPPPPSSKVLVLKGQFDLTVNAFFQKKDGRWKTLFAALAQTVTSPLFSTFGIPGFATGGLAKDTLEFGQYALANLTKGDPLDPIWHPRPQTFALTEDVTREPLGFRDGLWCILEPDVYTKTDYLAGYTVDTKGMTFQVLNGSKEALNANYLVVDFKVTPA